MKSELGVAPKEWRRDRCRARPYGKKGTEVARQTSEDALRRDIAQRKTTFASTRGAWASVSSYLVDEPLVPGEFSHPNPEAPLQSLR